MERKGIQTDKGDYNRYVKNHNAQLQQCHFDIGRLTAQQKFEQMKLEKDLATKEATKKPKNSPYSFKVSMRHGN